MHTVQIQVDINLDWVLDDGFLLSGTKSKMNNIIIAMPSFLEGAILNSSIKNIFVFLYKMDWCRKIYNNNCDGFTLIRFHFN